MLLEAVEVVALRLQGQPLQRSFPVVQVVGLDQGLVVEVLCLHQGLSFWSLQVVQLH